MSNIIHNGLMAVAIAAMSFTLGHIDGLKSAKPLVIEERQLVRVCDALPVKKMPQLSIKAALKGYK